VGSFLKNIYFKKQITLKQILQESSNILKHKWSKINQNFNRKYLFSVHYPRNPQGVSCHSLFTFRAHRAPWFTFAA